MIKHKSPISGIATFKDQYVATAGYDNQVILWDAKNGQSLARGVHDHLANQCQFSHCGKYLISTSSDYTARLWHVPSMKLIAVFCDHEDDVESVDFHPTKELIATSSRDKHIRIFDFSGKLQHKFSGHKKDVISVAWLNENEILSSSDDGTVRKWDFTNKALLEIVDLHGVETDTLAITSNGIIFAGNDEGDILIINKNQLVKVKAHHSGIKKLCYSKEKNILISLSYDRNMVLWRITAENNLEPIITTSYPNIVWARSCALLDDNKIVLATFGTKYAIYDFINNTWHTDSIEDTIGINSVISENDNIYSIGDSGVLYLNGKAACKIPSLCNFLLKIGDAVITGGQTGSVYDALTGETIYQHSSPLNCATEYLHQNKKFVVVGTYTGEGLVFSLHHNQKLKFFKKVKLHNNAIKGIAANKKFIFSICADGSAAYHSIANLRIEKYLKSAHSKIANGCAKLNDEDFISVSRDLKIRVFSANGTKEIPTPHNNSIKCITVANSSNIIASADYTGNICLFNNNFEVILNTRLSSSGISSITADEEHSTFIASSYDGNLYFIKWDINNAFEIKRYLS